MNYARLISVQSTLVRGCIAILSCLCGGKCICPLHVLNRHIRPQRAHCTHAQVHYNVLTCHPSKVPLPVEDPSPHLIHRSLDLNETDA